MSSVVLDRRRLLAAASSLPLMAQAGRPRVGAVTSVRGSAFVRFGGDAPRSLASLDPLRLDDLVTTGMAARLECRLLGGIGVHLGERASLWLSRQVVAGLETGSFVGVSDGAVMLDVPAGRRSPLSLSLPWGRISTRGGQVWGGPLDGAYAAYVARGDAEVEAGGRQVTLAEGYGADVAGPGSPPEGVRRWREERIARALGQSS